MSACSDTTLLVAKVQESFRSLGVTDPSAYSVDSSSTFDQERRAQELVAAVTREVPEPIGRRIHEEFFGVGPLKSLLEDDSVTEIIVNGGKKIWFERAGQLQQHDDVFHSDLTYRNFIQRVCRETGTLATLDCPFADGQWREYRTHLIIPPAASDALLTLRRHPGNPWRLEKLESMNWADANAMLCLRQLIDRKWNFLVVGSTGSGKTSVLNACLQELPKKERVVIIEDTNELKIPNEASTKLLTRKDAQGLLREIDQSDLLKQSLRMRPDRLIMGEIRGAEAKDLLMAFATGHSGCIGTLHADSARQALLRLEMLIQLGASQWSLSAVRTLILLSLQAIVVVKRDADGRRRLDGIYKLTSLEDVGFLLEKMI